MGRLSLEFPLRKKIHVGKSPLAPPGVYVIAEQGDTQPSQTGAISSLVENQTKALVAAAGKIDGARSLSSASAMTAMAAFAGLPREELEIALAETMDTAMVPAVKMALLDVLLGQIAETDGPWALAYVEEHMIPLGSIGESVKANVMGTWAEHDQQAVWDYFQENKENLTDIEHTMALISVFSAMAKNDMDSALERLNGIDDVSHKLGAVGGLMFGAAWDDDARRTLLAASESMEKELRQKIQSKVVADWASMDAGAAVEWTLGVSNERERAALFDKAMQSLMRSNPSQGARILINNASEDDLPAVYEDITRQWVHRDPNAAGEWLSQQPQGPELDLARQRFSAVVAGEDPESAMAWAQTVVEPDARVEAIRRVYLQWSGLDAAAANAALEGANLTDEQLRAVRIPN